MYIYISVAILTQATVDITLPALSAKKYQVVHITSKQKTAEVLEDFNGYPLSAK